MGNYNQNNSKVDIYGCRTLQNIAKKLKIKVELKMEWAGYGWQVVARLVDREDYKKIWAEYEKMKNKEKEKRKRGLKRIKKENEKIKDFIKKNYKLSDNEIEDFLKLNQAGSGRILRKKIPLEEKIKIGLIAWIRHTRTDYDQVLSEKMEKIYRKYPLIDYLDYQEMKQEQEAAYIDLKNYYNNVAKKILESLKK